MYDGVSVVCLFLLLCLYGGCLCVVLNVVACKIRNIFVRYCVVVQIV